MSLNNFNTKPIFCNFLCVENGIVDLESVVDFIELNFINFIISLSS